ncbi:MAG: SDR family NAD(P)-dependent oxidoreductase [Sphingomonadales bacterium]|nr:SDR family NAD(P)-dependent oxidoreductase [Sphingomonadales bacterium]
MPALAGKVAVVTGASRGIGKGTALTLAAAGATVYATARTLHAGSHALPGSLEETVAQCAARGRETGGRAIAHALDLADDAAIAGLFARVHREAGRLDILVNNAMAIPAEMTSRLPFWEKPLSNWEIWDTGVRAAFIAAHHAARIMVAQKAGLIVGLSGYVGVTYTYDVIFGTTKTATDRMMRDMAVELAPHRVTALSLWQGFTYTERALRNLESVPGMAAQLNAAAGSTPEFPGRVIAALATDPELLARSGGSWINAELARDYGVTDTDGRSIESLRASRGTPIFQPIGAQR